MLVKTSVFPSILLIISEPIGHPAIAVSFSSSISQSETVYMEKKQITNASKPANACPSEVGTPTNILVGPEELEYLLAVQELERALPPMQDLIEWAKENRPPQSWYDE